MTEMAATVRDWAKQIVRSIWRIISRFFRWWTPVRIAGGVMLVGAILVGIWNYLNQRELCYLPETLRRIVVAFDNSATIELLSLAITIFVVDELYRRREEEREKRRLILQMGSPDNTFAREAVRALQSYGWLHDGSLKGANLGRANLQEAVLLDANLQKADLVLANFQGAFLVGACLQGALLWGANLKMANLESANLQEADLMGAVIQRTILVGAKLQGANLMNTNLQEANLTKAEYNNATRWPEGFTPPPGAVNVDAETNVED